MTIKKGFSKGKSMHGKGSSKLNTTSEYIDRRKKEHSAYRTSRASSYQCEFKESNDGFLVIVKENGDEVKTSAKYKGEDK